VKFFSLKHVCVPMPFQFQTRLRLWRPRGRVKLDTFDQYARCTLAALLALCGSHVSFVASPSRPRRRSPHCFA
jgi:hypothetical protein